MSKTARALGHTNIQVKHHRRAIGAATGTIVSMSILIVMAAYFALPLIWMVISTTKSQYSVVSSPMFEFPAHWNLISNLKLLSTIDSGIFWHWFLNSMIYSLSVAILATAVSTMIGYALAKYVFKGNGFIRWVVVASLMIPGAVSVIPVFILERSMGILDTYWGVILPQVVNPFGAYFMVMYIQQALPDELLEAARIDGASEWRTFVSIAMGIIKPGLATLFLIIFVGSWNNFFLPLLLLTKSTLFPLTLGLNDWLSSIQNQGLNLPLYPLLITGSVISILPMVVLFPFMQKYIASGLTQGGIKI